MGAYLLRCVCLTGHLLMSFCVIRSHLVEFVKIASITILTSYLYHVGLVGNKTNPEIMLDY